MEHNPEKLFLLEFLVDSVKIQKTPSLIGQLSRECNWYKGQTCVSFQFLGFPMLQVCEADFQPSASDECSIFKNGKSCLFSVPDMVVYDASNEIAVDVAVHRKLPSGISPEKLLVGQVKFSLKENFVQVLTEVNNNPDEAPVSRTIKDTYVLTNDSNKAVGLITAFIRLSCFGNFIVTQFQLADENKAFLFKGAEEHSTMYQCKKINSKQIRDQKKECPPCQQMKQKTSQQLKPVPSCMPCSPCIPCQPCSPCPPCEPCQQCSPPCNPCSPNNPCFPRKLESYDSVKDTCDCGQWNDALGYGSRDNFGTYDFDPCACCPHVAAKREQAVGMCQCKMISGNNMNETRPRMDPCMCRDPPYPCYVPPCGLKSDSLPMGVPKSRRYDFRCADVVRGDQFTPGKSRSDIHKFKVDDNQVSVSLPMSRGDGKDCDAAAVMYKVNTCTPAGLPGDKEKTFQIIPQGICCNKCVPGGTDDGRDVFVLKIGKKEDGPEEKSKIELELRTPKRPGPAPPPPVLETHETQYEPEDFGEKPVKKIEVGAGKKETKKKNSIGNGQGNGKKAKGKGKKGKK